MKFGNQFYEARKKKGISQHEASQQLGVSPGFLSRVENGKQKPGLELIQRASLVYGVKSSYFMEPEIVDLAEVLPGKTLDGVSLTPQEVRGIIAFARAVRSINMDDMRG